MLPPPHYLLKVWNQKIQLWLSCGGWRVWVARRCPNSDRTAQIGQCRVCKIACPLPSPKDSKRKKSQLRSLVHLWKTWNQDLKQNKPPSHLQRLTLGKGEVGNKRHQAPIMAVSQSFIVFSEVYYRPQWKYYKFNQCIYFCTFVQVGGVLEQLSAFFFY